MFAFGDRASGEEHLALFYGEFAISDYEKITCRIHSSCITNEVFHAINCECAPELLYAMRTIHERGRGVIIYLAQEGRGAGLVGKMHQLKQMFEWKDGLIQQSVDESGVQISTVAAYEREGYPPECREFAIAADILKILGVSSVRLLTNNPLKVLGLTRNGIEVIKGECAIVS